MIIFAFYFADKVPSFTRSGVYPQHNSSATNSIGSSSSSQRYNKLNSLFSGNLSETSRLNDHRDS